MRAMHRKHIRCVCLCVCESARMYLVCRGAHIGLPVCAKERALLSVALVYFDILTAMQAFIHCNVNSLT